MNRQNNHVSYGFTDVTPGTYTLKAKCDPLKNYSGKQLNWLTNYTITLRADQIVRLGCEYYDTDKSQVDAQALKSYEDKSVWQKKKSDANKKVRRVRIVELSSRQTTN